MTVSQVVDALNECDGELPIIIAVQALDTQNFHIPATYQFDFEMLRNDKQVLIKVKGIAFRSDTKVRVK